jgi:hypothetical protein
MDLDILKKVIVLTSAMPSALETALNKAADEGWRLHDIACMAILKGGGIFIQAEGYYFEPNILIVEQGDERRTYRCRALSSGGRPDKDNALLNAEIERQCAEGFRLARLFPLTMVSANPEQPSKGTWAFLMVFESSDPSRA